MHLVIGGQDSLRADGISPTTFELTSSNTQTKSVGRTTSAIVVLSDNGKVFTHGEVNPTSSQLQSMLDSSSLQIEWRAIPIRQPVTKLACGEFHVIAILVDKSIASWGSNQYGQLGHDNRSNCSVISTLAGVIDVAAGERHSIALTEEAELFSWGDGTDGQLGVVGVQQQESSSSIPRKIATTSIQGRIIGISAGGRHNALISTVVVDEVVMNSVYTWGSGLHGQLGHGGTDSELAPVCVEALEGLGVSAVLPNVTGICKVECGTWHTVTCTADGDVYTFGWNKYGQLGHSMTTTPSCYRPKLVQGVETGPIQDIACGTRSSFLVFSSGATIVFGGEEEEVGVARSKSDQLQDSNVIELSCSGSKWIARCTKHIKANSS